MSRALCAALLALFTLYLLWVHRSYSLANTRIPTYDDAWYLESSLHFHHQLTTGGLGAFLKAYAASFGAKAPLISVLPVPFYLLFGASQHSAMMVNAFFIALSNLCLYGLVRRLFAPEIALAAVVFYQTMPLAYGLSRVFLADYGLTALVLLWLYLLAASDRLTRGPINFALGVVLGLGLLMKILFPAFIAGPLAVTLLARRREPAQPVEERRWFWSLCARRPLAAILVPGLALASSWYAFHIRTILTYAWQGAYGEIGGQYGGGLAQWALLVINRGISSYYTVALAVLGLAALAVTGRRLRFDPRAALLLAWLVPPLAAIAAGRNREIRFVAPLLPVFAVFLALAVFHLGGRRGAHAVLALLLTIVPQRLFAALSYPPAAHHHSNPVGWGPFVFFSRDLGWARPPSAEGDWEQQRILEALRRLAPPEASPRYVIVGVEHPYLNANLLSYLNAYSQYPLRFTSLGYAEASVEAAVERIYRFDARFLIMQEGLHDHDLPPFLNQVNRQVQERLDRGRLPFRLRAKVYLTAEIHAVLYERDEPFARFAPGEAWGPPARAMPVDFVSGVRFLGYDWRRLDGRLWTLDSYWTILHRVEEDFQANFEFRRGAHVVAARRQFVTEGRHPVFEWAPGEVVRQSTIVYLEPGPADSLEARLTLATWGYGDNHWIAGRTAKTSVITLRLEE